MTNPITTQTSLTASAARQNLYELIRVAAKGLRSYESRLRGSDPVVLMSKAELESWIETLDVMSNPEEVRAIREAKKQTRSIPLQKLLKELNLSVE